MWVHPSIYFCSTVSLLHIVPMRPQQPLLPVAAFQPFWFEILESQCRNHHFLPLRGPFPSKFDIVITKKLLYEGMEVWYRYMTGIELR